MFLAPFFISFYIFWLAVEIKQTLNDCIHILISLSFYIFYSLFSYIVVHFRLFKTNVPSVMFLSSDARRTAAGKRIQNHGTFRNNLYKFFHEWCWLAGKMEFIFLFYREIKTTRIRPCMFGMWAFTVCTSYDVFTLMSEISLMRSSCSQSFIPRYNAPPYQPTHLQGIGSCRHLPPIGKHEEVSFRLKNSLTISNPHRTPMQP